MPMMLKYSQHPGTTEIIRQVRQIEKKTERK